MKVLNSTKKFFISALFAKLFRFVYQIIVTQNLKKVKRCPPHFCEKIDNNDKQSAKNALKSPFSLDKHRKGAYNVFCITIIINS